MATRHALDITRSESRGSVLLWFGLLAAPIAWVAQLLVNYSLEEWFACSPGSNEAGEVLGLSVPGIAFGVTGLLAVLAAAGGAVAITCYRRIRVGDDDESERARWMALAGIFNSVLYFIIIIASFGPPLILGVCETSP